MLTANHSIRTGPTTLSFARWIQVTLLKKLQDLQLWYWILMLTVSHTNQNWSYCSVIGKLNFLEKASCQLLQWAQNCPEISLPYDHSLLEASASPFQCIHAKWNCQSGRACFVSLLGAVNSTLPLINDDMEQSYYKTQNQMRSTGFSIVSL
jgi:hypothetical protein